jgi:hypothetical protein
MTNKQAALIAAAIFVAGETGASFTSHTDYVINKAGEFQRYLDGKDKEEEQ